MSSRHPLWASIRGSLPSQPGIRPLLALGELESWKLLREAAYRAVWRRTRRRVQRLYGYRPAVQWAHGQRER